VTLVVPPGDGRAYDMGPRISTVFKAETDAYSISEWWLEPDTLGPGTHHHDDDDLFFVLEGTVSFLVDGSWVDAPAGSFVAVPGGTEHDFRNRSSARAGFLNISSPGGFEVNMPGIAEWFRERDGT
jgi:mannose-6-phosphate isomerase-like protein (cupin superfamily)